MSGERQPFSSVASALGSWGRLGRREQERVLEVVDHLAGVLGAVSSVYIGQRGNAVGVMFGGVDEVQLYVHGSYVDVAPSAVAACGGIAALAEWFPGVRPGPGQRSAYGRIAFPGRSERSVSVSESSGVAKALHCGLDQVVGTECMFCGETVAPS